MGKSKSKPKKPKPLLSHQGILHLQNSFVQPTQESGLLSTVGGGVSEQGLVLAPNYGYGVAASTLVDNESENTSSPHNGSEIEEIISNDANVNSSDSGQDSRSTKENDSNPEDLSVAELVRQIGGAKGKALCRREVVEDREDVLREQAPTEAIGVPETEEEKIQTDEFYASIGRPRPDATPGEENVVPDEDGGTDTEASKGANEAPSVEENIPESISEYYKSMTNYYYSSKPDPYSKDKIEFGHAFLPSQIDTNSSAGIIELARIAQKQKRAMDAAIAAAHAANSRTIATDDAGSKTKQGHEECYDPLPMEIIPSESTASLNITADTGLEQYWDYVRETPHDFNRWTYLIHYAENSGNLNECRVVYSSFLPLFPYCFGYWKRYCELEKGHHYFQRAITILQRGLEFNPLCVDLWLSYLNLYCAVFAHEVNYESMVRQQYEKALSSAGMDFRSDALWDAFIDWEQSQKKMKQVFTLYRRLNQVPTRLYNRHWDNLQALIRDHHPRDILNRDYYEKLRKKGCKIMGFKYKPEPEFEQGEIRKTSKPEDQLMDHVKSKVLERLKVLHDKTAVETDKRWDFEDMIRRPYFHVKPLDKRQLKNWELYINFEIKEGNHDRIILLFERCLTACAQYESFWCRYGRYVENYHKKNRIAATNISVHLQKSQINVEIVSKKQTEEEEALIEDVECLLNNLILYVEQQEAYEVSEVQSALENVLTNVCNLEQSKPEVSDVESEVEKFYGTVSTSSQPTHLSGNSGKQPESPPKFQQQSVNNNSSSSSGLLSLISVPVLPPAQFYWQEIVRDIYKRACVIHCPRKPTCRLQWAAFEEEIGNAEEARCLIIHVLEWFPTHLAAKVQLIELERRRSNLEVVENLFDEYLSKCKSKQEFSVLALKYARFLTKELAKPDKALVILRQAVKKDKSNCRIYSQIFELCYDRFPTDRKGAVAALQIAIKCKELSNQEKLIFSKKMVHFLQEHGDLRSYRDAIDQLYEFETIVYKEKEAEKMLTAYNVPSRSDMMTAFPAPDWDSVLEKCNKAAETGTSIQFEKIDDSDSRSELKEEEVAYKEVAPTRELLVGSDYGYGSKHPDVKLSEQMAQKEYEQLESKGYAEHLLDKEGDTVSRKRKLDPNVPLYIVAPKGSYLMSYLGGPNTGENPPVPGGDVKRLKLEPPVELKLLPMPSESPCINVPDWFVKEGGELCLSETPRGFSIIRYWPHFISETGNNKMFRAVRRCVKWHQKQHLIGGRWRHLTRLVSWLGPCDYSYNGLDLVRNENWPPEILDLLHRLIQMTRHEFNSCFLNLYRTGHDNIGWHSDSSPAFGANPSIASVSLGAMRLFELRRRGLVHNFIRFPLFPGSLLVMEGATQEDWSHQIPKEPLIKEERVNLTFRVMHAVDNVDKIPGYKPVQPKSAIIASNECSENGIATTPTSTISVTTTLDSKICDDKSTASESTGPKQNESQPPKIIFHKK